MAPFPAPLTLASASSINNLCQVLLGPLHTLIGLRRQNARDAILGNALHNVLSEIYYTGVHFE